MTEPFIKNANGTLCCIFKIPEKATSETAPTLIVWGTQTGGAGYAPGATLNVVGRGRIWVDMYNSSGTKVIDHQYLVLNAGDTTGTQVFFLTTAALASVADTYTLWLYIDTTGSTTLSGFQKFSDVLKSYTVTLLPTP